MIDRPFLRGAKFTSGTTTTNPGNPAFADLVQLVRVGDIPSEDAALVEDIFLVSNEGYPNNQAYTAAFGIYVFAPNAASPSTSTPLMIAKFEVGLSGAVEGIIRRIELPKIDAPLPGVGNTALDRPIELGASEGLYLEKGYILAAGYFGAGPNGSAGALSPSGMFMYAQGGFY